MVGRETLRALEEHLGTGFQSLTVHPSPTDHGLYCPYGASGKCLGVNDLNYSRCSSLNCEDCFNYQLNEQQKEMEEEQRAKKRASIPLKVSIPFKVSSSLSDTVIMSGDEVVADRKPKPLSMPVDEAFDEGLTDISETISFARSFRSPRTGAWEEYDHRR